MSDYIIVRELELYCQIGCTEAERAFPQKLLVSLTIATNTRAVAKSLDLSQSVDYAAVTQFVREFCVSRTWTLQEELAEEITTLILREFSAAQSVQATIQKFAVPGTAWTGVEITRRR